MWRAQGRGEEFNLDRAWGLAGVGGGILSVEPRNSLSGRDQRTIPLYKLSLEPGCKPPGLTTRNGGGGVPEQIKEVLTALCLFICLGGVS